ncbi:hypothetical protein DM860_016684 [Cuscuta australis]|uniref:Protein Iojap-related, mitochondrial n=1 Tax=Cuscuta australis TaxID=267555 RepID=A0A328DPT1_9ASTE|nr:hypothetical protein DM860_016684 [Cuscuta australis]
MWSVLRSRIVSPPSKQLGFSPSLLNRSLHSSAADSGGELLKLDEVEKILSDVKADNVQVIRIPKRDELLSDYMVVATGRSAWHVRNIAQALIYKVKQKQKGAERMLLPSVEGEEGGNWIVIDSGSVIVHALDEKVRSYYNLESLWGTDASNGEGCGQDKDLEQAFAKVRPKNNSKKRPKAIESRA